MEYGLRRYEATQRLLWFVFFLLCLLAARPAAKMYRDPYLGASSSPSHQPRDFQDLKSSAFWIELQGIQTQPKSGGDPAKSVQGVKSDEKQVYHPVDPRFLASVLIYFIWVGVLFVVGRFLWLLLQVLGKQLTKGILETHIEKASSRPKPGVSNAADLERLFPTELLFRKVNRWPLLILFHSFQRLRLMLNGPQGAVSSEELIEKERRIVETDWQILWSSWTPFRWLLWILPLLGFFLAASLFYEELQPALSGKREIQDVISRLLMSLLPLVQVIVVAVAFTLGSGLMKRLESLYLSSLDALFYDRFLCHLPFQSSDTLILLETMQRHFVELQRGLRRLERSMLNERDRSTAGEKEPKETKS